MQKILLAFLLTSFQIKAIQLEDYLPKDTRYDTTIPTPRAVTGLEIGQRHYRHDQIVHYLSILAASSSRAKLIDYGMTHEGRRLVLLIISSDKNMEHTDQLLKDKSLLRVWNGFSVHGNEASGANASLLYAYHLVAGHSEAINKILNKTVVIIDPAINPDGYDRFVTDVNSMRGQADNSDRNDASHQQAIPNGRTNHYWFDLNRDWLLLTQVESQARLKQFHYWQPHVLDDHHEMASDRTFFFQPGVKERTNPLIPEQNIALTNELAHFHAKALDEVGMAYYTQESYDDFYPGKGSTYPDLQGSVGILFEQSSAKGGYLKTKEGMRTLQSGINNQFRTALSTLSGSFAIKDKLIKYQQTFFTNALLAAKSEDFNGYVLDFKNSSFKENKILDFFATHSINVHKLKKTLTLNNHKFSKNTSLYISLDQEQYTLIKSLFSTETSFKDNTFYDVSAWNIALAWGIRYSKVKSLPEFTKADKIKPINSYDANAIAYAFSWGDGNAAGALNYLQQKGIKTSISSQAFSVKIQGKTISFKAGSIIIPYPKTMNENNKNAIISSLSVMAEFYGISSYALANGLNKTGIDLGSPSIVSSKQPKTLLVMGEDINSYQAGSIWHLFDATIGLALTKINKIQLKDIDLHDYTHLILPTGNYKSISEETIAKLQAWNKHGGNIIALQKSALWVEKKLQNLEKDKTTAVSATNKSYESFEADQARNTIGGAIILAHADLSHPLAFGIHHEKQYPLLQGNSFIQTSKNPYSTPLIADAKALAAGYISAEKLKQVNDSAMVVADVVGKGRIIKFAFNPTFRGFWLGTQKWLINAVYFSHLIKKTKV